MILRGNGPYPKEMRRINQTVKYSIHEAYFNRLTIIVFIDR